MPQHFILQEKGRNFNQIVSWGVCEESSCSGEGVPPLRRETVPVLLCGRTRAGCPRYETRAGCPRHGIPTGHSYHFSHTCEPSMKLPRPSPRAAAIVTNGHPCHSCERLSPLRRQGQESRMWGGYYFARSATSSALSTSS